MDFKLKIKNWLEYLRALPDNKKKIIMWSVVGIVALVMGGFWINGAVKSFSKIGQSVGDIKLPQIDMPNIQTPSGNVNVDTSDWKTYINTQYGFEIKYPTSGSFKVVDSGSYLLFNANIDNIDNQACTWDSLKIQKSGYSNIDQWEEETKRDIETDKPGDEGSVRPAGKISSSENIDVQGKLGKKITYTENSYPFYYAEFGVINNGKLYNIELPAYGGIAPIDTGDEKNCPLKMEDYKNIFDNMISTFKFTK